MELDRLVWCEMGKRLFSILSLGLALIVAMTLAMNLRGLMALKDLQTLSHLASVAQTSEHHHDEDHHKPKASGAHTHRHQHSPDEPEHEHSHSDFALYLSGLSLPQLGATLVGSFDLTDPLATLIASSDSLPMSFNPASVLRPPIS